MKLDELKSDTTQKTLYLSWIRAADEKQAARGWEILKGSSIADIVDDNEFMIRDRNIHISPIRWHKRHRLQANFYRSYGIGVECDDGFPLDEFLLLVKDFRGFVHTSHHHNKPKGSSPACDRYHCFLEFSRPVETLDEHRVINKYLLQNIFTMADQKTYDGARKFRCAKDCQIIPLTGTKAIDVDRCLVEAKKLGIESGYEGEVLFEAAGLGVIKSEIKDVVVDLSIHQKWTADKPDTYMKVWKSIYAATIAGYEVDDIAASVADLDWVQVWLRDHHVRQDDYLRQVGKAAAAAKKHSAIIKPIALKFLEGNGQRLVLDGATLPPLLPEVLATYNKHEAAKGLVEGKVERTGATDQMLTAQAVQHLLLQGISGRLNAGCGAGKSIAAGATICALANQDRRIWIARRTCDEVRKTRDDYIKIFGGHSLAVVGMHGFDPKHCCMVKRYGADTDLFYDKKRTPCKRCPTPCPFATRFTNSAWREAPVVVTTHEMFFRQYEQQMLPRDISIVFDEQIQRLLSIDLPVGWYAETIKELRAIRRKHGSRTIHKEWERLLVHVEWTLHRQDRMAKTVLDSGDVVADKTERFPVGDRSYSRMLHKIKDHLSDDMYDTLNNWINYQSINARNMISSTDEVVSLRKDRLLYTEEGLEVKQVLVLDGSAALDRARWELPEIVVDGLSQRLYRGTTVHVLTALPTKRNAKRYRSELLSYADVELCSTAPCLITNAKPVQEELDWAEDNGGLIITNGSGARGSNAGRDCDSVIITSSLFTSVSDTAGVAAAAGNNHLTGNRVWDGKKPRMNGKGFVDPELQELFLKSIVDLAQQAAHRGKIRQDQQARFDVVMTLPSWRGLVEFLRYVPANEVQFVPLPDRLTDMGMKIFVELYNNRIGLDISEARQLAK